MVINLKYTIYGNQEYNEQIMNKLGKIGYQFDIENPQLIISVGGDGTMLSAVRKYFSRIDEVIFLGINSGRLGFYTEFLPEELDEMARALRSKTLHECNFNLLEFSLISDDETINYLALNDLAITNPIYTQIIEVYINDLHFETFRGTGFLLSTPSGSTAYSKSLGGSVVHPSVKSFQLTEIASINNRLFKTISSPLVLSKDHTISLKSKNYNNIFIVADGVEVSLPKVHTIKARLSKKAARFLTKDQDGFWQRVKRAFIE